MERNNHMNQIKSSSSWRPYGLPKHHNKTNTMNGTKTKTLAPLQQFPLKIRKTVQIMRLK